MSYTQQFQDRITLKKTISVAFEYTDAKGNTQHRTKQVPVEISEDLNFHINVDTDSFDKSINTCSTECNHLQNSVVATEAAEIASKSANAMKLAQTLGNGFVRLIFSNTDMQVKEEKAKAAALLIELTKQFDDLQKKKETMEFDYNHIKMRYIDTFQKLDEKLNERIQTLQKDTFELISQSTQTLSRETETELMATALIGHKENMQLQTALCVSSMKQKTQQLIQSAYKYISETIKLGCQIQKQLIDENITEKETKMVPILYCETRGEQSGIISELYNNELLKKQHVDSFLLKQTIQSFPLTWKQMDPETIKRITFYMEKELTGYAQNDARGKRIVNKIRSLWQQQPLALSTN